MRNNPKHGAKLEYHDAFVKHARIEKIRRFFSSKKQKIYKHFCIQPYQATFSKKHIKEYIQSLDGFLQMNDKLINNFNTDNIFKELKSSDPVQFEELYEVLTKWATSE